MHYLGADKGIHRSTAQKYQSGDTSIVSTLRLLFQEINENIPQKPSQSHHQLQKLSQIIKSNARSQYGSSRIFSCESPLTPPQPCDYFNSWRDFNNFIL